MKGYKRSVALVLSFVFFAQEMWGQCAMCKGTAGTTGEDGKVIQAGINSGILYLLALPFLLAGTVAVLYWLNLRRIKAAISHVD